MDRHRDHPTAADLTVGVPPRLPPGGRTLSLPLWKERFVCILRPGRQAQRWLRQVVASLPMVAWRPPDRASATR